ncbi:MAG: lycopene cyclase family protein [Planctomycetota bacterium]
MIPTSVAIAGGGCAGLSLARSLVERFTEMRVTIIEPRESWQNDRTWCRWAFPDCRDEPATTHRWSRMRVRGGGFDKTLDIAGTPYVHIPAGAFTDGVVQQLRATGRCELRLGESVHGIGSHHDGATVSIGGEDTATPLRFDFVFDARPPERESLDGRRGLLQHFLGEEIRLERPVLDPETAIVMDFGVDQSEGLAFMYVLPFAPDRALFEATFLKPRLADQPDYQEMIRRYCEEELGSGIGESIREESGALPMTTGPLGPPATARVWPIGTRAGVDLACLLDPEQRRATLAEAQTGQRQVVFDGTAHATPLYAREALPADEIQGSAINPRDTTLLIPPGDRVRSDAIGNLILEVAP